MKSFVPIFWYFSTISDVSNSVYEFKLLLIMDEGPYWLNSGHYPWMMNSFILGVTLEFNFSEP